nr:hypothetical protein [Providencia rettgeri]
MTCQRDSDWSVLFAEVNSATIGSVYHCKPKPYYPVPGERVIEYSDEDGRSDMKYMTIDI